MMRTRFRKSPWKPRWAPQRTGTMGRRRVMFLLAVGVVALVLQLVGAQPAVSQGSELVANRVDHEMDLDPDAPVWFRAKPVEMPLTSQLVAWPVGGGSIKTLEARAVHTDDMLYVRLSWSDDTLDTAITALDGFVDGAAIEFPAQAGSSVPALCMGQSDNGVNIWHWQAGMVDGRPESISELSVDGYVDRYPSTDDLYFPARAAGNPVAQPRMMNDLVAVGFGTLTGATEQAVQGRAEWINGRWEVVFARELSSASIDQIDVADGTKVDVAFAVWNGSTKDRNGKKSVSQFAVLEVTSEGFAKQRAVPIALMVGGVIVAAALVFQEISGRKRLETVPKDGGPTALTPGVATAASASTAPASGMAAPVGASTASTPLPPGPPSSGAT